MQLEQIKPNKPSFPWVLFWFCTGIIAVFIVAIVVIRTHYRKRQSTPYTNSPAVSQLVRPSLAPELPSQLTTNYRDLGGPV